MQSSQERFVFGIEIEYNYLLINNYKMKGKKINLTVSAPKRHICLIPKLSISDLPYDVFENMGEYARTKFRMTCINFRDNIQEPPHRELSIYEHMEMGNYKTVLDSINSGEIDADYNLAFQIMNRQRLLIETKIAMAILNRISDECPDENNTPGVHLVLLSEDDYAINNYNFFRKWKNPNSFLTCSYISIWFKYLLSHCKTKMLEYIHKNFSVQFDIYFNDVIAKETNIVRYVKGTYEEKSNFLSFFVSSGWYRKIGFIQFNDEFIENSDEYRKYFLSFTDYINRYLRKFHISHKDEAYDKNIVLVARNPKDIYNYINRMYEIFGLYPISDKEYVYWKNLIPLEYHRYFYDDSDDEEW